MDSKKPAETTACKTNVLIGPFESRATRMLKAALNQKAPLREHVPSSENDQVIFKRVQQIDDGSRRRSSKGSVAFTDPVVSIEHEYEPTYLDDEAQGDVGVQEKRDHPTPAKFRPKAASPVMSKLDATSETSYTRDNSKKGYGGKVEDDDDDDDDLFILARSDEIIIKEEKLIERVAKGAPKRNYEAMQSSEDERDSEKQKTGKAETDGGGLFSSPKVAKIAPYFDDRPQERRAAEAKVIQQNRARSQQNSYQRSRTISTHKTYIRRNSGEFTVTDKSKRPPSINLQTHERVTELISYKKVSSPKLGDRNVMNATEATKLQSDSYCKTEQQMPGYFNWFTSFITNQMNKLIF